MTIIALTKIKIIFYQIYNIIRFVYDLDISKNEHFFCFFFEWN